MRSQPSNLVLVAIIAGGIFLNSGSTGAGELIVDLGKSEGITLVGAISRWDEDGNARVAVDPKGQIESPRVDAPSRIRTGWPLELS